MKFGKLFAMLAMVAVATTACQNEPENITPNNGQKETRRPDVILLVNGMPLCVIELKNPADAHATIFDA